MKKVDLHLKCMLEFQMERKSNLYKCLNYNNFFTPLPEAAAFFIRPI